MATIEWVNHASYLMRVGDITLLCDPWLEGSAFKDGWRHLSATAFDYERFAGVSHIWLSHQHPDHFAPANLKRIPAADRRRIVVLYQETEDRLVLSWLKSNGFVNAREIPVKRWLRLSSELEIMLGRQGHDSWLAARADGKSFLNVNDCVLKNRERIQAVIDAVGTADVLFTQFSYAQWVGNPDDREARKADAREKLERIRLQVEMLHPRIVVPFASYIYFCHEENFFMNDGVNQVADVAAFLEEELHVIPAVLYPGEVWDTASVPADWHISSQRYAEDFRRRIDAGPAAFVRPTPPDQVIPHIASFLRRLKQKNPRASRLVSGKTVFFATDVGVAYEISMRGIREVSTRPEDADICTSLENVMYAFRTPWGGNTLHVSGRFTSYVPGGHLQFFKIMRELHHYNVTIVDLKWVRRQILRALRGARSRLERYSGMRRRLQSLR